MINIRVSYDKHDFNFILSLRVVITASFLNASKFKAFLVLYKNIELINNETINSFVSHSSFCSDSRPY